MTFFPLPYNDEVSELAWPQVSEVKIPRYTLLGADALINSEMFHIDTSETAVAAKS